MYNLSLLLVCVFSVEIFIRLNFYYLSVSILKLAQKVIHILHKNSISDHWKQRVILAYALTIMKNSAILLLILFLILSLFFIADLFLNEFLSYAVSLFGTLASIAFAIGYIYLRKSLMK